MDDTTTLVYYIYKYKQNWVTRGMQNIPSEHNQNSTFRKIRFTERVSSSKKNKNTKFCKWSLFLWDTNRQKLTATCPKRENIFIDTGNDWKFKRITRSLYKFRDVYSISRDYAIGDMPNAEIGDTSRYVMQNNFVRYSRQILQWRRYAYSIVYRINYGILS